MGITVAAGGLLLTFNVHYLEKWVKKYFTIMFAIIVAYILSDLTSQISLVFLGKGFGTLSKIAVFFESFFSSLLMPFLTIYMHKLIGKNIFSKNFFVIMTLWAFYFITLLVTQVTTDIYYVTEDNVYKRGPYYPILLVPAAALMAVNLWYLYRIRNRISRNNLISLCLYILIPLVAMAVQMFSYGLLFVVFGISVSAMLLFSFIMRDQSGKEAQYGKGQLCIGELIKAGCFWPQKKIELKCFIGFIFILM